MKYDEDEANNGVIIDDNENRIGTLLALFNTIDSSVSSFEDTLAAIRRMLQANPSGITLVDDYKISSVKNDAKYEQVIRLFGDLKTSGKYVSGNKVVDESITGMSVITGEKRPRLQQSSYARILFMDLEQSPVNLNCLTELQSSKSDVNSFIVIFIRFILQYDNFDHDYVELFESYRDELIKDCAYTGMYGRYYSIYGWLTAM